MSITTNNRVHTTSNQTNASAPAQPATNQTTVPKKSIFEREFDDFNLADQNGVKDSYITRSELKKDLCYDLKLEKNEIENLSEDIDDLFYKHAGDDNKLNVVEFDEMKAKLKDLKWKYGAAKKGVDVNKALSGWTTGNDQDFIKKTVDNLTKEEIVDFLKGYNKGRIGNEAINGLYGIVGGFLADIAIPAGAIALGAPEFSLPAASILLPPAIGATTAYAASDDDFFLQTQREYGFDGKEDVMRSVARKLAEYADSKGKHSLRRQILEIVNVKHFTEVEANKLDELAQRVCWLR